MERYKRIYDEMVSLIRSFKTVDPKMFGYVMSFSMKIGSFELMYRNTLKRSKELERAFKNESTEKKVLLNETSKKLHETIAFFEAYLNAFYSLLQIIAKVTPLFYEEKLEIGNHLGDNFGNLINSLRTNTEIDPEFSSYITTNLGWYKTLRNNRNMITHEGTAFLGFKKDGKIIFIDYPSRKEGFSWFERNKSTRELEKYLSKSFNDLFDLLDFYVKHFRQSQKPS